MIPIYEQGDGRGIGHGLESFLARFDEICAEHVREHRARAFAFIFYDFQDDALKKILKDQGVFTMLDRLAGNELSVFFFHAPRTIQRLRDFNRTFLSKLGVDDGVHPPCVVSFGVREGAIHDVTVAQLDHANILHGFHELYEVLQRYITESDAAPAPGSLVRWMKGAGRFIGLEVFRAALSTGMGKVF